MLEVEHTENFVREMPFQKAPLRLHLDFRRLSFFNVGPCITLQSQLLEFVSEPPGR